MRRILFSCIIILLSLTIIPKILFPTQHTNWNVFYERQVREFFYQGRIQRYDNLSYLGRYMSYTPGYFVAKASFLNIFPLGYNSFSDLIFELLLNISLVISIIFLCKNLGLRDLETALFILVFTSCLYVFVLLSAHLMQTLAIALTFFSLGFIFCNQENRKKKLINDFASILLLSAAALVHPFSLIMFSLLSIGIKIDAIKKIEEFKSVLYQIFKITFFSLLIFLLFYFRTLLDLWMPYEALAHEWGWFRHFGFFAISGEFFFLTPIVLFLPLIGLLNKEMRKLSSLIIILIIVYSFISFRVNVCISFFVALLLSRMINTRFLKSREIILFLFLLALSNSIFLIYRLGNYVKPCIDSGYLSQECLSAIDFSRYLDGDKILVDPMLAHAITFIAEKKVLADLFVEYANESMLLDALNFASSGELEIGKKWNLDLALTRFDCKNYSTLYDNGYYKICDLRK